MLRRRVPRGQALVEFALVLPIVLLLMMGVFDFGRAVFAYNSLSNAAREGARVAIVDQTVNGGVPVGATEAANQATGLGLVPSDPNQVKVKYLLPDLTGDCSITRDLGCVAEVTVKYQFRAITPIIGNIVGPINLSATTQLPIEFTKPPAP